MWVTNIDNDFFGDFNPYQEVINGDWLVNKNGREHHLGEVYLNGKALYEIDSLEKVLLEEPLQGAKDQEGSKYKWYCSSNATTTSIYANFKGANPNEELVEINVRPTVFFPKKTGVDYITVCGFKMCHAATQWAPPTAEQTGLIGPNWSKGWIIENNLICDSKCSGISIGKERSTGQNEWSSLKVKHGTQRQREVVFRALQMGWSKENVGSHVIRNNVIKDCEQTGICGHLGGIFSQIYCNHIYNIHVKRQFFGFELGGIKLHAPIDVFIKGNCIHDCFRGIWLDWQAQGTRVSGNLLFNNQDQDCMIEVTHGPLLVDNNIMLSVESILNASQGTAYVHNFFGGGFKLWRVMDRFTPYHYPHSTQVAGLMTINSGDDRFYNNIFASQQASNETRKSGLDMFNDYPIATDDWCGGTSVNDYGNHKYPVYIRSNLYYNKAEPFNRETNSVVNRNAEAKFSIEQDGKDFYLLVEMDDCFMSLKTQLISTQMLGTAFQSEALYENTDGSSIIISNDFLGQSRKTDLPTVGPIESLQPGKNRIKLFVEN